MALTYAHADGRPVFEWRDLIEAMTTIESGTAIGVDYVPEETRAVAIHEAGHAVASHVYMQDVLSTRLSIRMRGQSLGHHQAIQKEERFSAWRHEQVGTLVWTLGAMAAEHVFYGENSVGVGGDLQSVTWIAGSMVGAAGMAPTKIDVNGGTFDGVSGERAQRRIEKRLEDLGNRLLNSGVNSFDALHDRSKRPLMARFLGEAFVTAYAFIELNKDAVERIADDLIAKEEIYGNDLVALLDRQNLKKPEIDWTKDETWPRI